MKHRAIILFLLLQAALLAAVTGSVGLTGFARLQYGGGGDWYNDPEVLPNLASYVNATLNTSFPEDQAVVKADEARLFEFPFVYLTGHGNISWSDREIENLRDWMMRGGFLYADDDYGMDASFRREFHGPSGSSPAFPAGLPKIHLHDEKPPQAFGVFDDNGRLMCLYTYESNISDGWADPSTHKDPPEIREAALRFGCNIVYYLLTRS